MKKVLFFALAVFSICVLSTQIVGASVITLQPGPEGKDTWIWDGEEISHGDWGEIRVNMTSAYNQYGLIEFDLSSVSIPSGHNVTSVELALYRYAGYPLGTPGLTVDVHQITSSWTEDVTWSTKPSINSGVESSTIIYGNGWYTWDVTNLSKDWLEGTIDNYGVALYDHGTDYYQRFVSSDNSVATEPYWDLPPTEASLRPYLKITTSVIPEPVSMLLLGAGLFGFGVTRKRK